MQIERASKELYNLLGQSEVTSEAMNRAAYRFLQAASIFILASADFPDKVALRAHVTLCKAAEAVTEGDYPAMRTFPMRSLETILNEWDCESFDNRTINDLLHPRN